MKIAAFDVIAAISTPPGKGGVAIIRVSGDGAFRVAERVFLSAVEKDFSALPPRVQCYGYVMDGDERVDDVLLTKFPAPHSYTGEDTVEISCHGGILVQRTLLELLYKSGARPAEAGEYTRRAFINGRITLTDAEAIGTLLDAKSRDQMRLAGERSRTRLTERLDEIRARLVGLMSSVYARIDYPDEDLGDYTDAELSEELGAVAHDMSSLADTYRTGRAVSEGISAVICGKPNVGKSSLYNLLVGEDAAIVTSVEGTTRDVLERTVPLGRVMLRLADTAGIRDTDTVDEVERIGIERSRKMMEKCELLFAIFDISRPVDDYDRWLIDEIEKIDCPRIALLNKCDETAHFDGTVLDGRFDAVLEISTVANTDEAVKALADVVNKLYTNEKITVGEDAIISSARQHAALLRALELVCTARDALAMGVPQDAVSSDIERAIGALGELDGREVGEAVVADIFSRFCVGK